MSTNTEGDKVSRFESMMVPHLDAAYNLARWLTRCADQADEVVQEAYLRAFRYFDSFTGSDGSVWLLAIVRNCCLSSYRRRKKDEVPLMSDCTDRNPANSLQKSELLKQIAPVPCATALRRCRASIARPWLCGNSRSSRTNELPMQLRSRSARSCPVYPEPEERLQDCMAAKGEKQ